MLKSRGLILTDTSRAEAYLRNVGYYRLSAYMLPFLSMPKTDHQFKPGTTFDNVLDIYRFDKKLRVLLFNEIEKIEIAFREAVANVTAEHIAEELGLTIDGVDYNIRKLKKDGLIIRIGEYEGGHWEASV